MRRDLSELCQDEDELQTRPCKQPRIEREISSDDLEDEIVGPVWTLCTATDRLLALVKDSPGQGVPDRMKSRLQHAAAKLTEVVQACSASETVSQNAELSDEVATTQPTLQTQVISSNVLSVRQISTDSSPSPKSSDEALAETKLSPHKNLVRTPEQKSEGKENQVGKGPVQWCQDLRYSREYIEGMVRDLRLMKTQVVRYRDKATNEVVNARVPSGVVALVHMRAFCDGVQMSDDRVGRMAVDAMAAQAYDPVRTIASLCPASFLPPAVAMHVLGAGENGTVFHDRASKSVLKVMVDDNGPHEYDIQHKFAEAGVAPRPISFEGPYEVPNPKGSLYLLRMEVIDGTLENLLNNWVPSGPYSGLRAPDKTTAECIGKKLVAVLALLRDRHLVHGDMHMENIGLKGSGKDAQVMVIDFSRSCTPPPPDKAVHKAAVEDGHAYDVFRLIVEMCDSWEMLSTAYTTYLKEPEKELRALEKKSGGDLPDIEHEMHQIRQIASLRAYLAEQRNAIEQTELAYNAVLGAIVQYAVGKLAFSFDGVASVKNRRLKSASKKRQLISEKAYFNSAMYWLGFKFE